VGVPPSHQAGANDSDPYARAPVHVIATVRRSLPAPSDIPSTHRRTN
jgi:hypothetical protein